MDCMDQWEMHICARHDTCDLITSDVFKLLKLSFEKDGSIKTLNERIALMARMDRNWRSLGFPDSPQLPDAFRFLSYQIKLNTISTNRGQAYLLGACAPKL